MLIIGEVSLIVGGTLARKFMEEVERVVERLSEKDVEDLMHNLDHCLLMANKFYETRKPEYYARMEATCEKFMKMLRGFKKKVSRRTRG
jgi:hypothetical protein